MKKSKKEIKLIKKAASIANSCINFIEKVLESRKIRENELALILEKKIKSLGGKPAFKTLVASGKRAYKIHAKPSSKYIKGLGYIDFGVDYKGYKVDVTVPFIKSKIGKEEEKIVKTLIEAYELAKKETKVGINCFSVFEKVDKFLRKKGYKMKHSLGHGIGKKVHELPIIGIPKGKKKEIKFENGMVFTLEPGIYVRNVGGCRIENTFLLYNNNLIELTKARLFVVE
ncbi:MAG: M24 family metallopeptidase [Candidatus Aenigmatarchaeota archaeon]